LRTGCEDARVTSLIGLGAPVNNTDFSYLTHCPKPKLFVHGSNDMYGAVDKLKAVVAAVPNKIVIVDDADHFFVGKLDQVDAAITNWMSDRISDTGKRG
jgi:alpha/beta superfamily hydrolase